MSNELRHPVRYRLEALGFRAVIGFLALLPLDTASGLMGALFRSLGPRLRVTRRAERNLRHAFPDWSQGEISNVIRRMWDHLGRLVAEYAHLEDLHCFHENSRIEVVNPEILTQTKTPDGGAIVITGHIGNWEAQGFAATDQGIRAAVVYRAANNPLVDRHLYNLRKAIVDAQIPKGAGGARGILKYLKSGGVVAMLVDQKMNDGVPIPFFGRDAMTASAPVEIAYKYGYPLIPLRSERLGGSRFRVTVYPPLDLPNTGDRAADVRTTLIEINKMLETWIRERPEQWLWLHNRWPATDQSATDETTSDRPKVQDQGTRQTN